MDGQLSGHSFVIDGYDENGLVHVNWGWDGIGNGYYDIALLNPVVGTESMSFSSNQDMVVCQKEPLTVYSNIGMGSITVKKVTDNSVSVNVTKVTNLLTNDFTGKLAIIAEKDGVKHVIASTDKKLVFGVSYSGILGEPEYSVADLEDGQYCVYAAAMNENDPDWQIFRATRGGKNSYTLTKKDGTISLTSNKDAWTTGVFPVPIAGRKTQTASNTYVYDINGRLVYTAPSSTFQISDVPVNGILLVKQGEKIKKIAIM